MKSYKEQRDALIPLAEKKTDAAMKGLRFPGKKDREAAWNKRFHREMDKLSQECGIAWIGTYENNRV